jgi:hypothetical protein
MQAYLAELAGLRGTCARRSLACSTGGGSRPRLCDRQSLRQPAEAGPGAPAHAGPFRGRDQIFWHGLDRNDLPWDRKTRLALKFKLGSGELLAAHRDELFDLDGENPRFDVPLKRVKKRRVIGPTTAAANTSVKIAAAGRHVASSRSESPSISCFRHPCWSSRYRRFLVTIRGGLAVEIQHVLDAVDLRPAHVRVGR